MARRPVVLLGEVHDNQTQHALRAAAMKLLLATGARPAIAFEQFDREHQADLNRARAEPLPANTTRADHLITRARGAQSWNWNLYRPYLQLALDHDLPIVAANLSRAAAMRVAQQGFQSAFDADVRSENNLDRLPASMFAAHEQAVDIGHCQLMPAAMLLALARAQIARDLALALSIRPHAARGIVLLTGNGHARNDIGVPFFLTPAERAQTITIGLLEESSERRTNAEAQFDVLVWTAAQPRDDPCKSLREREGAR